jgi:fucose 4-O-acetylase-like acetyltransferase
MTLPGALLAFLIATACGLAFHLVRGGSLYRMAQYVFAAWVCFFAGHWQAHAPCSTSGPGIACVQPTCDRLLRWGAP